MSATKPYYDTDLNRVLKQTGFTVYEVRHEDYKFRFYNRKDFFKICLMHGTHVIHYADRTFEAEGTILFFGNPRIPYSWEIKSETYRGFTCLFSESFLNREKRLESLQNSPFFKTGGTPIFQVDERQAEEITSIFQKMLTDSASTYSYKNELLRNYTQLLIHEALKMQPSVSQASGSPATSRIASVFLELLERQFPVEDSDRPLTMRSPQDFARSLSVHVNYLNRSVKELTGKPTSVLVSERILQEAKALLQHSNWNISEIAYALGFSYPSHFNSFFKRMTGSTPRDHRFREV